MPYATSSRSPLTAVAESVCGRICLWNMSAPSHPALSESATAEGLFSGVELDITSDESISSAFEEVKSKHGRLDVLINNAAVFPQNIALKREVWLTTFATNLLGSVVIMRKFSTVLSASRSDPVT